MSVRVGDGEARVPARRALLRGADGARAGAAAARSHHIQRHVRHRSRLREHEVRVSSIRAHERRAHERWRILLLYADHSVFRMLVLVHVVRNLYTYTTYFSTITLYADYILCTVWIQYKYLCQIKLPLSNLELNYSN